MASAWIGLLGVLVGSVVSYLTARAGASSSAAIAQQARRDEEARAFREAAADAYTDAAEAVQWLSVMHVEDSVIPQFREEFEPKTARAVMQLRTARTALTRLTALGGPEELRSVIAETVLGLHILDQEWHGTQRARIRYDNVSDARKEESLDYLRKKIGDLSAARKALSGLGGDLAIKEAKLGNVLPGSMLFRLREEIARSV